MNRKDTIIGISFIVLLSGVVVWASVDVYLKNLEHERWMNLTPQEKAEEWKKNWQETVAKITSEETKTQLSEQSGFSELYCLELIGKENWKELGYLQGDFLDELVCREDLKRVFSKLEDVPPEKLVETINLLKQNNP